MKKNILAYSVLIVSVALFYSCKFSTGIKKDLNTGLTSTYSGLSAEEIIDKLFSPNHYKFRRLDIC